MATFGQPIVASPNMLPSTANVFSASTAYSAGDYVWYNGKLYCFTADHAAGAWTGSDASEAKLADDIADLKSAIDEVGVMYDITLPNDYYYAGKRLNCKYGRFDMGVLRITKLPDGFRAGLRGYVKSDYRGSYSYDSGWITSVPFEVEVNPNLYYFVQVVKNDFSDVSDVSIPNNGFEMHNIYTIEDRADLLEREDDGIRNAYAPKVSTTVKTIAHRGDCVHGPQNTAPAYIMAKNHGLDIAENDISLSSDGEYVMWHDVTLERLGNLVDINGYEVYTDGETLYYYNASTSKLYTYTTEYVESAVSVASLTRCNGENYRTSYLTLAELKRIDFGVYKGSAFKGTQILTFEDWVLLCKQIGMDIYIDFRISLSGAIVDDLNEILVKYGMQKNATWANVQTTSVADMIRAVDEDARLVTFNNPTADNVSEFAPYNTGRGFAFGGNGNTLTQAAAQLALDAGINVECYYVEYASTTEVNILNKIRTLVSFGVSGMTLDYFRVDEAFAATLKQFPSPQSY